MTENTNQGFEPMATKIDPAMAVVWNAICEALGTDTYHMLQHFISTMIRMASDAHSVSPDVQKMMKLLDVDAAWQNAINLCAPNGKRTIAQMVLIVEEPGKQGFAMTMLNKPFCGDVIQIDNVNKIIERTIEIGLSGIYKDIRMMKARMRTDNISDVLLRMLDDQQLLDITEEERQEMAGQAMYNDYGRKVEYGKKTKGYKHRTPDSLANGQQRIVFDDYDREVADYESGKRDGEHKGNSDVGLTEDFRPFDVEW